MGAYVRGLALRISPTLALALALAIEGAKRWT